MFLTDRIKDMIVSGGENVYPVEVENALAEHPAVADVAVIGVPTSAGARRSRPSSCGAPASTLTDDELIAFARERLAALQVPDVGRLRRRAAAQPVGKLLKRVLREPYWQGRERRIN